MTKLNIKPLNGGLRILGFLNLTFGHPVYLGISFVLSIGLKWYTAIDTNVFLVYLFPFAGLLFIFAFLRLWIFNKMHRKANYPDRYALLDKFIRINIWCMPGLFIFVMMLMPVEANIFGFVFAPLIIIFSIILGPLIFIQSYRSALSK